MRSNGKTPLKHSKPKLTVALCGNPNSGKTTLFNLLTGSNQKVGNWPGVTVEQKTGFYKQDLSVAVVDTPGIYSLSPFTLDEQVAHNYLMQGHPDVVINVVDSTNLERNLFLTSQLMELDVPVVVALNMKDEAEAKGIHVNTQTLEESFACKFFEISALNNDGVEGLMQFCIAGKWQEKRHFTFGNVVESNAQKLFSVANGASNKRWICLKLLENDKNVASALPLTDQQKLLINQVSQQTQAQLGDVVSAKIAQFRYDSISKIVEKAQSIVAKSPSQEKAQRITEKIDRFALNKLLAFPIFALVMAGIFYLSIGSIGGFLTDLINQRLTPWLQQTIATWLEPANVPWLRGLVVDGIVGGVMGVVGFVPQIMLLFGCIAILEDSGYMSRIAFITDKLLNKIGLGGRSFVSMVLGCGCSVPAIMATRSIKNVKERNATITLTPFMPCSAKMAIISFFTTYLLGKNALFAISFYLLSIVAVVLGGLALKLLRGKPSTEEDTFIMELPNYRAPKATNVLKQMWERGKAFLVKAGTVIFTASVALWVLQSFNFRLEMVSTENSILATVGKAIAPIFAPLGFDDGGCGWQFSVATLTGVVAKETVVTTLEILLKGNATGSISQLGAYSFVAFNLLTVPCVATISASFAEQGNWKNGAKSALFQFVTAYAVSLAIYQVGRFAQKYPTAFVVAVSCTVIALLLFGAIKHMAKSRGCNDGCKSCPNNGACAKEKRKN